ncbi:MAG: alanine--tRNA ligase [Candidatus Lokiarchaeota archaeon]|nr:alanine--tRNA ligase [Candidatus Lokiarchaeota archaeon]
MKTKELRQKYLDFFKEKDHKVIGSASLMPENDPTVLFTTAGMHPLVPFLLGQRHPQGKRLVDVQKCIRTTDIDEVGDTTHLTFFEMLGNWSLGDYWKEEAITWSYEFLTSKKWLGIDPESLSITVFEGDDDAPRDEESVEVWKKVGIPEDRIYYLPKKDNWWGPAGQTGPCGPCTEMFIEIKGIPKCSSDCQPGCNCGHFVEIWNDVFMEYNKQEDGTYIQLKQKNVDTGMGVERTAAILQGVPTVYDTDLFVPLIDKVREYIEKEDETEQDIRYIRIIVDHVKSAVMIMSDDRKISPSNVEHGYIVRRLLRKAILGLDKLGIEKNIMKELAEIVIDMYKGIYEEVERNREFVMDNLEREEKKFRRTLRKALRKFNRIYDKKGKITGEDAFLLFTSFGLPIEMTKDLAEERGFRIDMKTFREEFEQHRDISRSGSDKKFKGGLADHSEIITKLHTATHLLQAALRKILGETVKQKGSNITKDRLRFDFTFQRKLTKEELEQVEQLVNEVIEKDLKVTQEFMSIEEAEERGALAFFTETYGDEVSVYSVGDFSKEVCGGPHVEHTGVLEHFRIKKQENIGAGLVRIRAIVESKSS